MNQPTREYGWLIIDTPEAKRTHAPKRATDESWDDGPPSCWYKVFPDGKFQDGTTYRRRIDPGDGWEIVPGDSSQSRDMEYTFNGTEWRPNNNLGIITCGAYLANTALPILAFRRRVTKQRRFWAVLAPNNYFLFESQDRAEHFSQLHAKPPQIVALTETDPPPPEKSPAEAAWDALTVEQRDKLIGSSTEESYIAGYEAGRAAK